MKPIQSFNAICSWAGPALFVPIVASAALTPNAAHAQQNTTRAQAAAETATVVGDVVVTAPSTSEAQATAKQSVPVSATILTTKQLEAAQISNLSEARKLEPSLGIKFQNFRSVAITIRGFGASDSNGTDGIVSGVPVYLDGIYLPRPGSAILDIPDLIGIEVLKGPQGTSGGMDSTGGSVGLATALPSFKPESKAEFSYGSYNLLQFKGSTTGPIANSDIAAFRLSLFSADRDGYVGNYSGGQKFNDWHDHGFRAQTLLTPSEDLTVRLITDYSHTNQACCVFLLNGVVPNLANGAAVANNFTDRAARVGYKPPSTDALGSYMADINGYQQYAQDGYGASAHVKYRLNGLTFSSLTAFRGFESLPNNRNNGVVAVDLLTNNGAYISEKTVQQEFRVTTPQGERVEATAGLFYFWEKLTNRGVSSYGSQAGAWFGSPPPTGSTPPTVALINNRNNTALNYASRNFYDNPETNVIAPFMKGVWHVTPEFDLTAGLRYSYTAKSAFYQQWQTGGGDLSTLSPADQKLAQTARDSLLGRNTSYTAATHQGLISALASASYKFTPDTMGYVTYSRGGRAGGVVVANLPAGVPNTVGAEEIDNYEVGFKSPFLDQRLLTNLAAFVMVDQNYITTVVGPIGAISQNYLANAKRAMSRGLEFDLRAKPVDGLDLFASAAYTDAFYSSFNNSACPFEQSYLGTCNFTGKALPLTPKFAFAIGGEYSHNLGFVLPWTARPAIGYIGADFTYQTKYFSNPNDTIYGIINAYGLLDLHAGLKPDDGSWDLSVWGHNVLNKRYFTSLTPVTAVSGGAIGGMVGDPLMVGFTFKVKI